MSFVYLYAYAVMSFVLSIAQLKRNRQCWAVIGRETSFEFPKRQWFLSAHIAYISDDLYIEPSTQDYAVFEDANLHFKFLPFFFV